MKEQLFNLQLKLQENSEAFKITEVIEGLSDDLKHNVTVVVKLMDEEKKKLHQIVGYVEEKCDAIERNIRSSQRGGVAYSPDSRQTFGVSSSTKFNQRNEIAVGNMNNLGIDVSSRPFEMQSNMNNGKSPNFKQHIQDADDDDTLFHSINCEYDIFDEVSKSFIQNPPNKRISQKESSSPLKKSKSGGYENVLTGIDNKGGSNKRHKLYERKEALLQCDAFKEYPIVDNSEHRDLLPVRKDPNQKLNIWELLKDLIGKDLTRIPLPVFFNEPLSFTQRFAEPLEYRQLTLEKAAACIAKDKILALGYCLGFVYCGYFNTYLRTKKPFNPLLFETYEYQEQDLKYITEQVCHHPPISAAYGETPKYTFWGDTRLQSKLGLSGMDIEPTGGYNIKFKQTGDHFVIHKCKSVAKNLVFGTTYVWQYGDMTVKNLTTGDTATLNFKVSFIFVYSKLGKRLDFF